MQADSQSVHHASTHPSSSPKSQQQNLPTGPIGVIKQRPAIAQLREAMNALHINKLCRAVSFELFTYWSPNGEVFPSVKTMAGGMGLKPRSVRRHIANLERLGLWVRIGREDETNIYILHLPGEGKEGFVKPSPQTVVPPPPDSGVPPSGQWCPPEVTTEVPNEVIAFSRRGRARCSNCNRTWPKSFGIICYKCSFTPSTPDNVQSPTAAAHARPPNCMCGSEHEDPSRWCVYCGGLRTNSQREWRVSQCQQ